VRASSPQGPPVTRRLRSSARYPKRFKPTGSACNPVVDVTLVDNASSPRGCACNPLERSYPFRLSASSPQGSACNAGVTSWFIDTLLASSPQGSACNPRLRRACGYPAALQAHRGPPVTR